MDLMQAGLIALIFVSIVCICALTIYLVLLLQSVKKFTDGLAKATDTINNELEPTLKDLKETLGGVNSLVKMTDARFKVLNCALNGIVGATGILGGKLKGVVNGVVEGFRAGISLFKK